MLPFTPTRLFGAIRQRGAKQLYIYRYQTPIPTQPLKDPGTPYSTLLLLQHRYLSNSSSKHINNSTFPTTDAKMSLDTLKPSDRQAWEVIFRKYIDFYQTSLPDEQYENAWQRIMDPKGDIEALVVRGENGELLGLAHYLWMATPWKQEMICNLNDLYVERSTRGKGYGTLLIKAVKDKAAEAGCFRLRWTTKHDNPARKMYDTLATTEFVEYRTPIN